MHTHEKDGHVVTKQSYDTVSQGRQRQFPAADAGTDSWDRCSRTTRACAVSKF